MRTLVLLHGAGGSARQWAWTARSLRAGVEAITVDLPGHADSAGFVPASIDDAARSVMEHLEALGVGFPVAVAGHSLGGMVALTLAFRWPDRVSHLGLLATAARIGVHPELLKQLRTGAIDPSFVRACFSPGVPEERHEMVVGDLRRTRLGPDATDFMGASSCDLGAAAASLHVPAVVLVARGDPVVSPRRSRVLASTVAGCRLETVSAGHYLHLERPVETARALSHLLDVSEAAG